MKRYLVLLAAAALAAGLGFSRPQPENKVRIPMPKTPVTDGKAMFNSYCATCHGKDAKGGGPVMGSLKQQPADLTMLAKSNGGKYPDTHVSTVLEYGVVVPAHGNAEMPIWGPLLGTMSKVNSQDRTLRIRNLVEYIKTLQQ